MPRHADFLLLGGGLASATAAQTLRSEGAEGSILIVCDEAIPPYNRPPLSKQVLHGTMDGARLFILDVAQSARDGIELLINTRARAVRPSDKIVATSREGEIHYGQLLIATGTTPRRLSVPGADLERLYYVRTLADAEALRSAAKPAKRAVVVGGSFLGLEIAAALSQRGLSVTVVDAEPVLFAPMMAPQVSSHILSHYRERGVTVLLGATVARLRGQGYVSEVILDSGATLACDLVAVAVGVEPNIAFLDGSGIGVDNGIVVDQFLRTNEAAVFAAGDVANYLDRVTGSRRRIEHWDSAVKQGRFVAKSMLGSRLAYDEVSYFYCDAFDFGFEFLGVPEGADRIVERGSIADKSYARIYLKDNAAQGLFTIGRPLSETKAIEAMIRFRVNLQAMLEKLADPTFGLEQIPNQTVLILQGGGAMGAFEGGVVRALEEAGIFTDIIAGVSIGAFNGAIIAGNPNNAAAALKAFWNELAVDTPAWGANDTGMAAFSSWYNLAVGSPNFFRPRWLNPMLALEQLPATWTSFYDTQPGKALLSRYVDFATLKQSPVRLLVSAVDVESGRLRVFDSYCDDITADHILASGSLPPGFPWTTIEGRHYWDGAIISNSPLEQVMERCGVAGKRVFIVDLFSNTRALPTNMMEVIARRDEIGFAERINKDVQTRELVQDYRNLIREMLDYVEPQSVALLQQRPRYIQLMGDLAPLAITRIVRQGEKVEPSSRDYDFSKTAVDKNWQDGYRQAKSALKAKVGT
jgi:NADPH-dependent 2,4-dienoyl-CoA reductase/sulfur reductase-like enzyme/predicted acylesterase/phospholipase RssA